MKAADHTHKGRIPFCPQRERIPGCSLAKGAKGRADDSAKGEAAAHSLDCGLVIKDLFQFSG
jgi:hypothetical protein